MTSEAEKIWLLGVRISIRKMREDYSLCIRLGIYGFIFPLYLYNGFYLRVLLIKRIMITKIN